MEIMYANKVTITVSGSEMYLNFALVAPEYDQNDQVSGSRIAGEQRIVMQRSGIDALERIIESIREDERKAAEESEHVGK